MPLLFTVAIEVLLLVHVPPAVPFVLNVIVDPVHTLDSPLIVPALPAVVTVTVFVAVALLHPTT